MSEWETRALGDVVGLQRGHDLPVSRRVPGSIPVLGSTGQVGIHNEAAYNGPGVMIGRSGVIGGAQYVESPYWPLNTTLFVCDFRGNYPRWIYYRLHAIDFSGFDSGSAQPSLNRNYVSGIRIRVPLVSEQRAIADVLGALDDKIAANSRLSDAARQAAVAHVSELPLSVHLKDIAELHKRTEVPAQIEAELVRHFSLPAFDAGQGPELVDPKDIKSSKFLIEAPSVLVSKLNPRFPRIWDVPKLTAVPSLSSTEFLVLRPLNQESVELLWAILSRRSFSTELASNVAGTSGSHQRVKPSIVMDAPVADPRQMAPQLKVLITSYLQVAAAHDQESSTLGQIRDALLPQLMSGNLRVRDAEKIVSNAV